MKVNQVIQGDCLEVMKTLPENSVDSICCDPPYELGFMGKSWDNTGIANNKEMWTECLRVLKPGGYLLSFGGTRTYHRMASAIEDAGFEVRDMIEWVYGSGFPKSLNVGKQINKLETEELSKGTSEWEGWGTALKPAHEPICMARKPLAEKTVAENVLKYGTGGINIDESRVETSKEDIEKSKKATTKNNGVSFSLATPDKKGTAVSISNLGRFPANLIHDNSEEVRECFPNVKTGSITKDINGRESNSLGKFNQFTGRHIGDNGNASRFFKSIIYQAKASKSERKLEDGSYSTHPTVKPIALMEYLIKVITPKGGIVLDPFAGSGSTLVAAKQNGFQYIGVELTPEYIPIIEARLINTQ